MPLYRQVNPWSPPTNDPVEPGPARRISRYQRRLQPAKKNLRFSKKSVAREKERAEAREKEPVAARDQSQRCEAWNHERRRAQQAGINRLLEDVFDRPVRLSDILRKHRIGDLAIHDLGRDKRDAFNDAFVAH